MSITGEFPILEEPDIESSTRDYASRFAGKAGCYLLETQSRVIGGLLREHAGGTLLDVGGGHGQLVGVYRDLGMDFRIQGSSENCFDELQSRVGRERLVVSNLRDLPFDDRSIDVVLSIRTMPHLRDWDVVLAEMCRVARTAVLVDYPTKASINGMLPFLFDLKKNAEGNTRTFRNFRKKEFARVLAGQGFDIVANEKQFFTPMVVHRMLGGRAFMRHSERAFGTLGLTQAFGSPAVLKAVRKGG